ncbi:UDP-glucuronosyl/UDP-glucosyltransferase protein [Dioscorea alata]|uniref:UDP-glucuronosyl/UDP-glucosyltransferase protein n=1 Tax=Dioscorea alata TaxID=55571 RepID=A0ACB7UFB0_DIOAL|nr:UDP-glucuronosyl/UDP-glucosyltransferase protein [Dioscorea alata]
MDAEILVIPFPHPGHIFPATELANHLAGRNLRITLLLPSTCSSISLHPLIRIHEFSVPSLIRLRPGLLEEIIIPVLTDLSSSSRPLCAIVDEMMGWIFDTCQELKIPTVSFFTSSACSAALEHATSRIPKDEVNPSRLLTVPGLPDDMALTTSDMTHLGPPLRYQRNNGPGGPDGPTTRNHGPKKRGLVASSSTVSLLMNTCDELEHVFLEYLAAEAGKPVWCVGPLLPIRFWETTGSGLVRDGEVRAKIESNVSEKDVIEWLDAKPRGSVIYVSFGSLVAPTEEELIELAAGLEESNQPFIWVVQAGTEIVNNAFFSQDEFARRTKGRGLVINGWGPQLLILSHVATGGYVCHCGWNSTLEALGYGVPVLTWPVRGDQILNAKLMTNRLKVGLPIKAEADAVVTRADVVNGIKKLMADDEVKKRATSIRSIFSQGFPKSSSASLDAFVNFLTTN